MLRYITRKRKVNYDEDVSGIVTDNVNQKETPDEITTPDQNCKKYKDKYQSSWLDQFKWLKFCPNTEKMTCHYCKEFSSTCYKTSTLTKHGTSATHMRRVKQALENEKNRNCMEKAVNNAVKKADTQIMGFMKTAYFITRNELPKSMMPSMVEFLKDMECPSVSSFNTSGYGAYLNQHAVDEMNESISRVLEEELFDKIKSSPFNSIMIDESTDISNSKRLLLYVRYIDSGAGKTAYIANVELKDGTAESIFNAMQKCLKEKAVLNILNTVAICTDGANVMTGCHNGVVTKLKEVNNKVVGIHCLAHRLALCLADASKFNPEIAKYQNTLKSVFTYFSTSAIRSNRLRGIQEVLDEPVLKYTELCSVRWLSVSSSVSVVFRTMESLRATLENDASLKTGDAAKAKGILKLISEFSFVALTHVMMDVLHPLNVLSKFLQNENLIISNVKKMINSTKSRLQELQITRGIHEEKFFSGLQGNVFKNSKLIDPCNSQKLSHDNLKSRFISHIINEMDRRFPTTTLEICSKFECIEPQSIAINDSNSKFGMDLIESLIQKFCPDINLDDALTEYALFKCVAVKNDEYEFPKFCKNFLFEHFHAFPIMSKILQIALVLPLTSVPCERGFSTQNRIKSKFRNSLNNKNLDILMRISELGPEKLSENQLLKACQVWQAMKNRRN